MTTELAEQEKIFRVEDTYATIFSRLNPRAIGHCNKLALSNRISFDAGHSCSDSRVGKFGPSVQTLRFVKRR